MTNHIIGLSDGKSPDGKRIPDPCDGIISGLIACDHAGVITAFSAEAEALTRLTASQVLGKKIIVLPAALRTVARQIISGGKSAVARQIKLPGRITLRVRAHALVARKKKPGALLVVEDVAAMRRLQKNIARLDRLANIGTLSASLAHEIKNGMVAIKTFVDLLLEKNPDTELAAVVSRELKRVETLAQQMLRAGSPVKIGLAPVRIHELLDHSLRLVQHQLDEKLITLRKTFGASSDVINGSGHQLEQVFMNLLLNALEATGPNGQLTVSTDDAPTPNGRARLRLTVSDTGVGIPQDNLEKVFDTFFTTKPNGTGLGLAISRRIIEEHNGEVTVESKANQGATFHILLPVTTA